MLLEVGSFNFTAAHVLNCCLGVVMYTYYAFTKNWIMSNLFGLAVAFNSLEVLSVFAKANSSTSNSILLWLDSYF
jgi:Signal peptide peptidase